MFRDQQPSSSPNGATKCDDKPAVAGTCTFCAAVKKKVRVIPDRNDLPPRCILIIIGSFAFIRSSLEWVGDHKMSANHVTQRLILFAYVRAGAVAAEQLCLRHEPY